MTDYEILNAAGVRAIADADALNAAEVDDQATALREAAASIAATAAVLVTATSGLSDVLDGVFAEALGLSGRGLTEHLSDSGAAMTRQATGYRAVAVEMRRTGRDIAELDTGGSGSETDMRARLQRAADFYAETVDGMEPLPPYDGPRVGEDAGSGAEPPLRDYTAPDATGTVGGPRIPDTGYTAANGPESEPQLQSGPALTTAAPSALPTAPGTGAASVIGPGGLYAPPPGVTGRGLVTGVVRGTPFAAPRSTTPTTPANSGVTRPVIGSRGVVSTATARTLGAAPGATGRPSGITANVTGAPTAPGRESTRRRGVDGERTYHWETTADTVAPVLGAEAPQRYRALDTGPLLFRDRLLDDEAGTR